jgi:hypothetical protein
MRISAPLYRAGFASSGQGDNLPPRSAYLCGRAGLAFAGPGICSKHVSASIITLACVAPPAKALSSPFVIQTSSFVALSQNSLVQKQAISGDELTTTKNGECVAVFFHSGPSESCNTLAFEILWLRTTMKNACGVFHSGPASFTVLRRLLPRLEPGPQNSVFLANRRWPVEVGVRVCVSKTRKRNATHQVGSPQVVRERKSSLSRRSV